MGGYGGSIASNPRVALVDITQNGTDWLWAAFAVMLCSALGMVVWAHSLHAGRRAFHYTAAVVLFTASIAYFCMASDLGGTPINVEFVRNTGNTYTGNQTPVNRSIWYVRYIDWVITTPMLLLTLLLSSGLPLSTIVFTIFMDLVMIITGLVGALVASQYKWGFFVFGNFAMFYVFWILIGPARRSANAISPEAGKAYTMSAFILAGLWFIYPIIWGIADGGNVISTDGEMVGYGVLDLLAKPVFTYFHMYAISKVPYESYRLQSGHYSIGALNGGAIGDYANLEKNGHGYTNGVNGTEMGATSSGMNGHATNGVTGTTATTGTRHPNVVQEFEQHHGTTAAPAAGVVQHTTA